MTVEIPYISATGNRLLNRLPPADYGRLLPLLTPVDLPAGTILYEPRGPVVDAYFPTGAVLSSLVLMGDGDAVEVGTVGKEGVAGYSPAGARTSPHRVIVQIGNAGLRIGADALAGEVARNSPLRALLNAYDEAFRAQVSQSVACNALHRLGQRFCRWLLMSRDRVGSDELRLTHEFLAVMLGSRRASVTDMLAPLQEAGLVRSSRGKITILDAAGLEARSCECYRAVKREYDRLLDSAETA